MTYDTNRHTIRPALRRAARAVALAAALFLPAAVLAAPAQAASSCTVNGVPVTSTVIRGTEAADTIECSSGVAADTLVEALGGDDTITLAGIVAGRVRGGDGADRSTLTSGELTGDLDGQMGRDVFEVRGPVKGNIRGGQDDDDIHLYGNAPVGPAADVRGAKGADKITLDVGADVDGLVEGNDERDEIRVLGTVNPSGKVHGNAGPDFIRVHINRGIVDPRPGPGDDCMVDVGNPCVPES
ncbi:hypothetical protein FGW37_14645 [Streptomyces rectiverticillatus]|uniref:hypothetical protein n=1 Tax=Streptomyces rectiverticillatus TaxID=173860 RepID=UPI0015C2E7D2|nr:hypothetical protein [Streptomyces rectiverticillatus]QLE72675.1 hypothetical protein FGW37_14645 [Streptomyces rectiverticillatus]